MRGGRPRPQMMTILKLHPLAAAGREPLVERRWLPGLRPNSRREFASSSCVARFVGFEFARDADPLALRLPPPR